MKLLQRFRKQGSREEMETQAAQELEAAVAAKPTDVPAMAPAAGLPGDDMNGSGGAGETPGAADTAARGENGEPLGSVTDLPKRRSASTRKTGTRKPAAGARTARAKAGAGAKAGATTAKPAGKDKAPVRKAAANKTASGSAGGTVKKRASAAGTSGTSGRASASRPPAAKKR
ncbi:MAG TPA: hypothetical protein VNA57_03115 [Acidimicrobiales bacterium]|nr:hypothetical protein [Acidimicrobiales bacterium]